MNYKELRTKLRSIAKQVLTQDDLAAKIIIQKGKSYRAYGRYIIDEVQDGWQVTIKEFDVLIHFSTAKTALTWCILDKTGKIGTAEHLRYLDSRVTTKQADIDILTKVLDTTKELPNRAILLARITEDIHTRQEYKKQLVFCQETAKYIKLKGTHNEFKRFNKTSRRSRHC